MSEQNKIPRYNAYQCEYGCLNVTVDVDKGVTPFMIKCKSVARPDRPLKKELTGADGECIGIARSTMYPTEGIPKNIKATHEWYKPDQIELDGNWKNKEAVRDHCKNGGLLLRKRTDKEPIYHE